MADKIIKVGEGDCISSIAFNYGITEWKKLYDHQEQKFKNSRKNPNSLVIGDQVKVPQGPELSDTKSTGSKVKITVAKTKTVRLRLVVIDSMGNAIKDKPYTLKWAVGVLSWGTKSGKTNAQGLIEADIPPNSRVAELKLDLTTPQPAAAAATALANDPKRYPPVINTADYCKTGEDQKREFIFHWKLSIGSLPSESTDNGIIERLANLGYVCVGGELISDVVKTFQKNNKLNVTGSLADAQTSVCSKHDII
jgi:hypothetical protein